jgi:Pirin C-terminal cupin domain
MSLERAGFTSCRHIIVPIWHYPLNTRGRSWKRRKGVVKEHATAAVTATQNQDNQGSDGLSSKLTTCNHFLPGLFRGWPIPKRGKRHGCPVLAQQGLQGIRFLLVSGKPIEEPVAWYGPIVMNTQAELNTAMRELQSGKFIKHS